MASDIEHSDSNSTLSFFDMFNNSDKKVIEDKEMIKQILYGNTKMIDNIEIKNKYLALIDNEENLLAIIEKGNGYSFIDV